MSNVSLFKGSNEWVLTLGDAQLKLDMQGRYTTLGSDFIVNPSKKSLKNGGGLNGVIHKAAGKELDKACGKLGKCETGSAKITKAGKLPHVAVIHTVGPDLREKNKTIRKPTAADKNDLSNCYVNSCKIADLYCKYVRNPNSKKLPGWLKKVKPHHEARLKQKLKNKTAVSITVPCISTGIFKYPAKQAAHIQVRSLVDYMTTHKKSVIKEVLISCQPGQKDVKSIQKAIVDIYKAKGGQ